MSSNLRPDFESLPQARKGKIGEQLVDLHLLNSGIVPYGPVVGAAHPFDRLCASRDKRNLFVVEVKTKARRTYYPDTGINESHYNDYIHVKEQHQIPVFLYFVDENMKQVYGGEIGFLARPATVLDRGRVLKYPLRQKGIIYFPLANMVKVCAIDDEAAMKLKALSTRNYAYPIAA